jgi:hypothetical protein
MSTKLNYKCTNATLLCLLTFFGPMHTGHVPCYSGHIRYLALTAYYFNGIPKMLRDLRTSNSTARHGREEAEKAIQGINRHLNVHENTIQ